MQRLSQSTAGIIRRITVLEAATVAAAAAIIAFQLFVPPIVGMADNGDFAKVAARLCMEPTPALRAADQRFWHFSITEYEVAPQHCLAWWQWSSMSIFAWMAKQLHDVGGSESSFDIRVLGAVCAAIWLACIWFALRLLRPAPTAVRLTAAVLLVLIFTDVLYIAYFHSFYGDCAAMILLFVTCLLAWRAAESPSPARILAFAASSSLLVWSKGPHVLIAPWLIALSLFWWWRGGGRAWLASAAIVLVASAGSLAVVPKGYASGTTFNVIFARLLPTSPDPVRVLAAFDLPPEAAVFAGEYVYTATNPYRDPAWRARYEGSLTAQRLALFYLRNPAAASHSLWRDLTGSAKMRLVVYYRHKGRRQPNVPARPLLGWSDLRSSLLRAVPWHLPLFYAIVLASACVVLIRGKERWQQSGAALCLAIGGAAVTEFVITSLFDALETERHLFVFHVLTEVLVLHAALAVAWVLTRRRALQEAL